MQFYEISNFDIIMLIMLHDLKIKKFIILRILIEELELFRLFSDLLFSE
jgi:hypothetical protein